MAMDPRYPLVRPRREVKNIGYTSLISSAGCVRGTALHMAKRGMKHSLNTLSNRSTRPSVNS